MESILKVENLNVSFETRGGIVNAVRGIDYDLKKGEMLGIVGESGSGKSVSSLALLDLLGSNGKITDGKAIFNGIDLTSLSKNEMRKIRGGDISMIFQDPMSSLNPLITVGKQVAEMLEVHKPQMTKDEIKSEVIELFKLVHIPEPQSRYNNYPHQFSGGMRQRVMIAMALACRPSIVIADEPTTALDVTIQHQILSLLRNLQSEMHTSVIFITHDLGVVAELCSKVIVMYGGMIMEEASVEDLFYKPSHPYTLGLLRSIPRLTQHKEEKLQPIPGSPPDMLNPPKGCPFSPRCEYARNICKDTLPEYFHISDTHRSMCHLLSSQAPIDNNPFKGDNKSGN